MQQRVITAALLVIACLAVAGGLAAWQAKQQAGARCGLDKIQFALQSYYENHGCYPESLAELSSSGELLEFPCNPYTGEPMSELAPGSKAVPGEVVYIPLKYVFSFRPGSGHPGEKQTGPNQFIISDWDACIAGATDIQYRVDNYYLILYGIPRINPPSPLPTGGDSTQETAKRLATIDWRRVDQVLSAGE